jgi:hypothetical protein
MSVYEMYLGGAVAAMVLFALTLGAVSWLMRTK